LETTNILLRFVSVEFDKLKEASILSFSDDECEFTIVFRESYNESVRESLNENPNQNENGRREAGGKKLMSKNEIRTAEMETRPRIASQTII